MAITVLQLQLIGKYFVIYTYIYNLKTFRENPCAFCLIISSIVSCGTLAFNLLSLILYRGFDQNITITSVFWCKIQTTAAQAFNLLMLTCICLAAIDQCMSTKIHGRHKGSSLKIMKCLFMIAFIMSSLHGIPFIIYWNIIDLPGTEGRICAASDHQGVFSKNLIYVYLPILTGFLPVLIMSILALIAFRNVRSVASFYIFLTSSARFRRQLKHVLIDRHLKQWRLKTQINRIHPTPGSEIRSITGDLELK